MAAASLFENSHGFLDVLQGVGVVFLQACLERSRKTDFAHEMKRDACLNAAAVGAAERQALFAFRDRLRSSVVFT